MVKKEILLNDQGLKVNCIIDEDDISFEFDNSCSFLSKLIRVETVRDIKLVYLGFKKILRITKDNVERILPVTTTEVRILRAYYNAMEELKSSKDLLSFFDEISNRIAVSIRNQKILNRKPWDDRRKISAEFHTHFVEILNGSEFIDFVNKHNIAFPINKDGELDFENGEEYTYKDIVFYGFDESLKNSLSLKKEVSNFDELKRVNRLRDKLIERCSKAYSKRLENDKEWAKTQKIIDENIERIESKISDLQKIKKTKSSKYHGKINDSISRLNDELNNLKDYRNTYSSCVVCNDLFDACLDKLSKEKVKYAEISYCNEKRIKYISDMHKGDERFKILFGMDRAKGIKHFARMSRDLESLLNDGMVIGADILGNEVPLDGSEYEKFKDQLEWILPVLHIHPNSVLRIHAGEFTNSTKNVYKTLKTIGEVSNKINKSCVDLFGKEWGVLPPPRIRIGHGINIEQNEELASVLREFDAVVEFNISSNYALGNVSNLGKLPLDYYDREGIEYVISTDGGGMYGTSLLQEQNIADSTKGTTEGESSYSKKAKETEKKIIEDNKRLDTEVKEEDRELFKKFMDHKSEIRSGRKYSNYRDALDDENKIFDGQSEDKKIVEELFRLKRYIMDNHLEYDDEYFESRERVVLEYNEQRLGDFSKIYLYLLEKEMFPEFDSSFRSVEYISSVKTNDNKMDLELSKIYNLVQNVYDAYSFGNGERRR